MFPNQHSQFGGHLAADGIAIPHSITKILQAISPLFSTDFPFFSFSVAFFRFPRWQVHTISKAAIFRLQGSLSQNVYVSMYGTSDLPLFYPI